MGYDEKMTGQAGRYDAKPNSMHTEKSVDSETMDMDMHISAPKTEALDSNKSMMGRAVTHLNRETQRGEHAPMVGGHKHDPLMGR